MISELSRFARRSLISAVFLALLCPMAAAAERFTRGDVDANGTVDLDDSRLLFAYLRGRDVELTCPDAADTDDNGVLNFRDIKRSLRYLFRRGRAPAAPGPTTCGSDPTPDGLGACVFEICQQELEEPASTEDWNPFESYLPEDRSADLLEHLAAARLQSALETALLSPGDSITLEFNEELAVSLEGIEITGSLTMNPSVTLTEDNTYEISFSYSRAKGAGVGISENIQATLTQSESANTVFEVGTVTDTVQALQSIALGEFLAPSLGILTEVLVDLERVLEGIEQLVNELPSLEQAVQAADAELERAEELEEEAEDALDDLVDGLRDANRIAEDLAEGLLDLICAVVRCSTRDRDQARAVVRSLEQAVDAAEQEFQAAIRNVSIAEEVRRLAREAADAAEAEIARLRGELASLEAQARIARILVESLDDGTRFLQAGLSRIEFEMAEGANVALFLAPFEGVTLANAGVGGELSAEEKIMLTLELDPNALPSGVTVLIGNEFAFDFSAGRVEGFDVAASMTTDTKLEFVPDLTQFREAGLEFELGLDAQVVGLVGIGAAVEVGAGREIGIGVSGIELGPLLGSLRELVAAGSVDGLQTVLADAEATASLQDRRVGGGLFVFGVDEVGSISGSVEWAQVGEALEKQLTSPDDILELFRLDAVEALVQTLVNEASGSP